MDTGLLSDEAYEAILSGAESFRHDLTLQFGLLSYRCDDEEEYLQKAVELIEELKELDRDELEDVFYEDIPARDALHKVLDAILANIRRVRMVPYKERHFEG
jgi:hypothetical protein